MSFRIPSYDWIPSTHLDKIRIKAGNGGCWIADIPFGRTRPLDSNAKEVAAAICALPEMYKALQEVKNCDLPEPVLHLVRSALEKADRDI